MKNFEFLIAAYSAIWLLIAYYFIGIGQKTQALFKKLNILENEKNED